MDEQTPSYRHIEAISAELRKLAQDGDWSSVARLSGQLQAIKPGKASPVDRAAIENALTNLREIEENAEYLRNDLQRLLSAFDKSG